MHPGFPPASAPLEIDRVEWVPASAQDVHVHLLGRWVDRPVAEPLVLLVGTARGRRSFAALDAPPAGVLAAFAVPNELRSRLTEDIALQIGAHEVALPPAAPGDSERDPAPEDAEGEVIDRAVLAERRARRAEQAEETLAARAGEAEKTAKTLEAQLGNLEEQLNGARAERDELQAALTDAEQRLRAAQQREYAEQERRIAAQDEAERLRGGQVGDVGDLHTRLGAAHRRAEDLARAVDEIGREVVAARAAREHAERELSRRVELQDRIVAQLRAMRAELEAIRTQAQGEAAELDSLRARLARAEIEGRLHRATAEDRELALRYANQTIDVLRAAAAETQQRLEEARRERAEQEAERPRPGDAADTAARAMREAAVRELVAEVLETAASLREAFEHESRKLEGELSARVAQERQAMASELQAMESRAAGLQAQFEDVGQELEAQLAAERTARWLAESEAELARERERSSGAELAELRAQLESSLPGADEPAAPANPAEAMIDDLDQAAERLREAAPPIPADQDDYEDDVLRPRLLVGAPAAPEPWLADAIARLETRDPDAAMRLVARLLPVQGLRWPEPLAYHLTLTGLGTFRVTLGGAGAGEVVAQPAPTTPGEVAFHLTGTPTQLAGLAAGGAPRRRARGTEIEGSRRALWRLLKVQRRPLTLAEIHRWGAPVEAELVLRALAARVEPGWTAGHEFTVAFAITGPEAATWTVAVGPAGASVLPGAPDGGATATVTLAGDALLPLLGGFFGRDASAARAAGDTRVVGLLREWFDRAQGLA